ncbi:MAG: rhodanese-like domain-containing protein [Robiginitomaculum sp.]|nr:rhodanese-like domain-containing protein [Robiginitomaculum sp.]
MSVSAQDLQKVQASLVKKYPGVDHIKIELLAQELQRAPDAFVLFDVREKAEYDVSHLPGAIWVEPGMTGTAFLTAHGQKIAGKMVVFYCSVGVRSSGLLDRVQNARVQNELYRQEAMEAYNLTGGLFAWHNQGRGLVRGLVPGLIPGLVPGLVNGHSPTDLIHPYNQQWGKLIKRRTHISYESAP